MTKKFDLNKSLNWIYPLVLIILFVPTYNSIFDSKVAFLEDNAGYYILGKSIADGNGYKNIYLENKPAATHFPPGYPAILAGVRMVAGDSISAPKIFNGMMLGASLVILFFFFRRIGMNIHLSFIINVLLIFNAHLLQYSTWIMSEVSYLFFSSLALLLLSYTDESKNPIKNIPFIAFIALTAASFYIRSLGVSLLAGAIFYFLLKLNWKYLGTTIAGFVILYFPWYLRGRDLPASTYVENLTLKNFYNPDEGYATFSDFVDRFLENLERYFSVEISSGMFGTPVDYQADFTGGQLFTGILLVAVMLFAIFKLKTHRFLVLGYLLGTFGILLLWPSVWFGIRFMFGIIPLLLGLFIFGMYSLVILILSKLKVENSKLTQVILPFAFIVMLPSIFGHVGDVQKKADEQLNPMFRHYFGIAEWSKTNIPEGSVVMTRKPKLYYLYANHFVTGIPKESNIELFFQKLDERKVSHIAFYPNNIFQRFFVPAYQAAPEKFKLIQKVSNPDVYLFEYHTELGYTGAYQDGKKHGQGSYDNGNGTVFEGTWNLDKREGKGIIKNKDGNILQEGIWADDKFVSPTEQ
jgi:hypothetical protein